MTEYLFRPPGCTPESRAGRPPRPRTERLGGMLIERDVAVEVAPGEPIYVDVYRPDAPAPVAPLIAWSPYGKHNPAPIGIIYPRSGVRPEDTSEITTFEAPDPVYWVPRGYAVITADVPGTWYSKGRATYCSPEEARAFAELIEWAGTQAWSNGRVGLSYYRGRHRTRFEAGERLLLVVQGSDVNRYPKPSVYARHEETVNNGPHVLHTGGRFASRLVVPVFPGAAAEGPGAAAGGLPG